MNWHVRSGTSWMMDVLILQIYRPIHQVPCTESAVVDECMKCMKNYPPTSNSPQLRIWAQHLFNLSFCIHIELEMTLPIFIFISSRLLYSLSTDSGGAMRDRVTEGENEITKCRVTSTLGSRRQHGLLCNLAARNTISFLPTASENDSKSSLCNLGKQQPPKLNRWHKVFSWKSYFCSDIWYDPLPLDR